MLASVKFTTKLFMAFIVWLSTHSFTYGQDVIDFWQDQAMPFYKKSNVKEYSEYCREGKICVYNVVKPTLTIYPAQEENSGKGIIILPGGGYETLAITHEGYEVAEVLAKQGITAAVLKYRLPNP